MTLNRRISCLVSASSRRVFQVLVIVLTGVITPVASADDWGAYALVPVSAPKMVLEAVGSGTADGTLVSLGKAAGTPNQKWIITPKGGDSYSIRPSYTSALVLAVEKGSDRRGAAIVLETDAGQPWQLWSIKKGDAGHYSFIPKNAPDKALDDNGGKQTAGARQDLWDYKPTDEHLQWMIEPLAGSPISATSTPADATTQPYVPPEIKPEDVLKGEIKKTTFTTSTIFPGTVRDVTVFIPAQYDGSKPACVYVKTDGYNPKEKALLETMIATKEIPVTIGVFVKPGELPPEMKGTLGRRNRCFEYDAVGNANARFFVEEILPFVAKEFSLKLSDSGNDRCISGGSSGGITAFNAAWERPDWFSRVYAISPSFVAFRGGHELSTLVRKTEAKPIRTYMTCATHDMENCAGDWYLLGQEMDAALKFSGYDYRFKIMEGRHVAGFYDNWQEGMAYLWKDWPAPVQAGPSAPRVQDVILPDQKWELAAEGLHDARGPACNAKGEVFFVDAQDNKIDRIDLDGKVGPFVSDAGQASSLSFGPDGQLYAVSSSTGTVIAYDVAGKPSEYADGIHGRYILAMPKGGVYVTGTGDKPEDSGDVWFIKDGKTTLVDSGMKFSTGLAHRPDQWMLSVADGHSKWLYSYQINPDGSLTNKERFFWLHVPDWEDDAGPESVCYSSEGKMFVATRFGIQVCTDDGPTQVILPLPDRTRPTGACLGGKDLDTLFAFCGDKVWKRKIKEHAMGAFSPWMKMTGGKL